MEHLDYPNEYCDIDPTPLELEIEERFMTARCEDSESDAE